MGSQNKTLRECTHTHGAQLFKFRKNQFDLSILFCYCKVA